MNLEQQVSLLEAQRAEAHSLRNLGSQDARFLGWKRSTRVVIERIFGSENGHVSDFSNIPFFPWYPAGDEMGYFNDQLEAAREILASMVGELRQFGVPMLSTDVTPEPMKLIEGLCLNFYRFVRQLQYRHEERSTIEIRDEYDVQDLMHALLRLHFDDVRTEDYVPSYAGGASRVDFLLKNEGIVVEVKKTRRTMKAKDLGEQLIVDRARYSAHPDCKFLICFVYDPEALIGNPAGIERDLELGAGNPAVRVIISPK